MDDKYKCGCMQIDESAVLDEMCAAIERAVNKAAHDRGVCAVATVNALSRVLGSMTYDVIIDESERAAYYEHISEQINVGRVHAEKSVAEGNGQRVDN